MNVSVSSMSSLTSLASKSSNLADLDRNHSCLTCNPSRRAGRKWRTLQLVALPAIPVLLLVALNMFHIQQDAEVMTSEHHLLKLSEEVGLLASLTTALLREDVALTFWAIINSSNVRSWHGVDLPGYFMDTDKLFQEADHMIPKSWHSAKSSLRELRDRAQQDDLREPELALHRKLAADLAEKLMYNNSENIPDSVQNYWWAFKQLLDCQVQFELEQLLGIQYFAQGDISIEKYSNLVAAESLVDDLLMSAFLSDPDLMADYETLYLNNHFLKTGFQDLRTTLKLHQSAEINNDIVVMWYSVSAKYFDIIVHLREKSLQKLAAIEAYPQIRRLTRNIVAYVIILVLQVPVLVFLFHNSSITSHCISAIVKMFASKAQEIKKERRKGEAILREMLPRSIVVKMEAGEDVKAEQFDSVTVYFGDIADFDDISATSRPMEIVNLLNNVYNFLDSRIEQYDVYKVETIGCTYMVASGVPMKNAGRHVEEVANMALDIRDSTEDLTIPHMPGCRLGFRMGVHTGCCVAGVVGNKTPRYCLFGDTVNTASRMQSTGVAHKIQVSSFTADTLAASGKYTLETRGVIHVKGKGSMSTFWLVSYSKQKPKKKLGVRMDVQREGMLDIS